MALTATGLSIGFPQRTVGEGLAMSLQPGRVACLLGPNGSGKTTLLRTLLALLPPLAGDLTLDGTPLRAWSAPRRARRLAYVPQAAESYFEFSALEMVEMGRASHRAVFSQPDAHDRRVALESLERLGVAALAGRAMRQLSGGERQLVLIARALATEATYLLLDEPTAHLDFGNQARVLEELRRLAGAGHGILLTTHAPDHAFAIGDDAYLLRDGRMMAAGPVAEAMTGANLSGLYGRPVEVMQAVAAGGRARRICIVS